MFEVIYWDDNKSQVITIDFKAEKEASKFVEKEFLFDTGKTFITLREKV